MDGKETAKFSGKKNRYRNGGDGDGDDNKRHKMERQQPNTTRNPKANIKTPILNPVFRLRSKTDPSCK